MNEKNSIDEKMKKVREYAEKNAENIQSEQDKAKDKPDDEPAGKMSWPKDELNTRRDLDDE